MKAIIPVAGAGTRLRPLTYTQPKPLIPVAGKPIISFIIERLLEVGVDEFIFVIGYMGEKIKNYVERKHPDIKMAFVNQHVRQGLGHAIWKSRAHIIGQEEIVIALGDTIFETNLQDFISNKHSCVAIKKVTDPRQFGVVEFDADGYINKVVEKPKIPKSNQAMVGLYKITEIEKFLEALDYQIENDIRTHNEYQLTDAIMSMIERGVRFEAKEVDQWFDCGKKEILLETNAMLLRREGYATIQSENHPNTIIIPPVSIGKGCKISNAIIGPNVAIGEHTEVKYSIIKDSIIGNYARIEEVVLNSSIVGNDAAIKGLSQSLNIGDNTEIDFS